MPAGSWRWSGNPARERIEYPPRLLFLAYYYPPWNTSGVQRAVRMVKYLPENGYSPHVICPAKEAFPPENRPFLMCPTPPQRESRPGHPARDPIPAAVPAL